MSEFDKLIALLESLQDNNYGHWVMDNEHTGTQNNPIRPPYLSYSKVVFDLIDAVYDFSKNNPDYNLGHYNKLLEERGLEWNHQSVKSADVYDMDAQGVMALLMALVRGERFCEGSISSALRKGIVQKWLFRLKQISEEEQKNPPTV